MADSSQDRKTEEPTARHLDDAREQGEVPRSRDISNFFVLAVVMLVMWLARAWFTQKLHLLGDLALQAPVDIATAGDDFAVFSVLTRFGHLIATICLPIVAVAALTAVLVNMVQTRALFAPAALVPKFERLNPVEGFKELFSRRALVELLKSLVKMLVLGAALYYVVITSLPSLVRMPYSSLSSVAYGLAAALVRFFVIGLIAFGAIAIFDAWFQRVDFLRRQRMTPEEVKRERRDDEGDPQMRARRRSLAAESMQQSLLERTASAGIVLRASGRSMAVALIIDPQGNFTPWLVNKGVGSVAAAILAVADQNKVRVVQDARLAKMIYDEVGIDSDLPKALVSRVNGLMAG